MRKLAPLIISLAVALVVFTTLTRKKTSVEPIAWYGTAPHPYISEVQGGAMAAGRDYNTRIYCMVGQDWSQDNENANVEALSTRGHRNQRGRGSAAAWCRPWGSSWAPSSTLSSNTDWSRYVLTTTTPTPSSAP